MDLFIMNRYIGEDEPKTQPKEEQQIKNLLSKISEKKKKSKTVEKNANKEQNKEESVVEEQEKKKVEFVGEEQEPKKKKRKRKIVDLLANHFEGDDSDEEDQDKVKRKKLKLNDIKSVDGFTIIGVNEFAKKQKVRRVLPTWLANPSIVSVDLQNLTTTIKDIPNLDKTLVKKLKKNGITHFFPVQSQLIPWLIAENRKPIIYRPCDVLVSAPTGSGKTLAFVLPIVQALKDRITPKIRAIVVLPVQELATQVYSVFKQYVKNTDLKVILLTGKNSINVEKKLLSYQHPLYGPQTLPDIIVTTAGRLVDHLHNTKEFSVESLRFLVIDEADRVMEHQQNDWLYHLAKRFTPMNNLTLTSLDKSLSTSPPQKLLFSATLSQDPEKLQNLNLFQPRLFTSIVEKNNKNEGLQNEETGTFVGKYSTPAELTERYLITPLGNKPLACFLLLTGNGILETRPRRILCFANSQNSAHRLALVLNHLGKDDGIKVEKMSAAMPGKNRDKILEEFTNGSIQVLVATDAMARGIDLPDVDMVISYDPASHLKTYIHRVGRTARAGQTGIAVTCLIDTQIKPFKQMLTQAGKTQIEPLEFTEKHTNPIQKKYQQALETLACGIEKERTEKKIKEKHIKRQAHKKIKKRKFTNKL